MWREDFEDGIFEDEEQGNARQKLCCVGVVCVYLVCRIWVGTWLLLLLLLLLFVV